MLRAAPAQGGSRQALREAQPPAFREQQAAAAAATAAATRQLQHGRMVQAVASATPFQLRVCTGKVCKRQGSPQVCFGVGRWRGRLLGSAASNMHAQAHGRPCLCGHSPLTAQVAKFAQDLHLPLVEVQTCGCLGECGWGFERTGRGGVELAWA